MSILLEAIKTHTPDKIALMEAHYQVTYGDLQKNIASRAQSIKGLNCAALAMDNGIEWVLWDLAAMFSNVALVPLPPFFTQEQRDHALRSAGCDAIITPDGVIPLLYERIKLPDGVAKVTFTSGTTGTPKGVCLSLEAMENVARSIVDVLGEGFAGIHTSVLPLAVLLENVAGVYTSLMAGGTVYLNHLENFGKNYEKLHSILQETKATSIILVPEILRILMAQVAQHGPLESLTYIAVGGSKVSPDLITQSRALGLPVYEGYGLSECASVVAMNTPPNDAPGTSGKPLPHIRAHIEDGEVVLRNTGFLGYIGEAAPAHISTGDLGEINQNGFISITGRKKNILITSYGRNISPEWVEAELLSQPEIAQAVVYGDAESSLSAYIAPAARSADIENAIIRANARLPDYAHIRNFSLVPPFSPNDGTLTGTGRPRRSRIFQLYQKEKIHDVL